MLCSTFREENGEKEYIQVNEGSPDLTDHQKGDNGGEKRIYLEGSLNYKRIFNDVHDISGLLLYMQKERQTQGSGLPYKKQSVVARVSYGYDSRYMVEGSFGLTGSENFAKGHRYGIFPAVGLAWYISNEKFMETTEDIINKLKLRASYGITGNDDVGGTRFPYRGSLNNVVMATLSVLMSEQMAEARIILAKVSSKVLFLHLIYHGRWKKRKT